MTNKQKALQTVFVVALTLACVSAGLKLVGDLSQSKAEMKACQQLWANAGYSELEAKSECRR